MEFLETLDIVVIAIFLAISLGIGVIYRKSASKNLESFFLGGRNLPWYIAGVSMVATTFAADTPLTITEIVGANGISGNWLWWNLLLGGMLTTFFFSKLWRRAEVMTELELIQIRYGGKSAQYLRYFKSIYLGLFINAVIIAWVNIALMSILEVFFGISKDMQLLIVSAIMLFTFIYSSMSGLLGVAISDFFQFVVAMTGCIILAVIVVNSDEIGGIQGLKDKLPAETFNFLPALGSSKSDLFVITWPLFFAYTCFLWWSSWYPGAEPGGGGYIVQRILSTKNEKHAILSTLFFQIAHYALRPWPWILVGLAAMVLYPELNADSKRLGYIMVIRDYMPVGLKGLLLVAFLAAYMSTISTQLNWGSSYLINDFLKGLVKEEKSDKQWILYSRLATFLIMILGIYITTKINSIKEVWEFLFQCGAGLGGVLIFRWFWYRINVWSEISATISPFVFYYVSNNILEYNFENSLFFTVTATSIIWITVSLLTKPSDDETLKKFYAKIKPAGIWGKFADNNKAISINPWIFVAWISATCFTYTILFSIGKLILQEWNDLFLNLAVMVVSILTLLYSNKKGKIFS